LQRSREEFCGDATESRSEPGCSADCSWLQKKYPREWKKWGEIKRERERGGWGDWLGDHVAAGPVCCLSTR